MTDTSAKEKDPKDFIEHLRTIHFTLLAICLALIVIFSSPSSSSIETANSQLKQLTELKESWDLYFVRNAVKAKSIPSCVAQFPPVLLSVNGRNVKINFKEYPRAVRGAQELLQVGSLQWHYEQPKSIQAFRQFWDYPFTLYCADVEFKKVLYWDDNGIVETLLVKQLPADSKADSVDLILLPNNYQDVPKEAGLPENGYTFIRDPAQWDRLNPPRYNVAIPAVGGLEIRLDVRQVIREALPLYKWPHADFKGAFYELDQATTGFQHLGFEDLKLILLAQQRNTERQFEAFGVKFPLETTGRWGIVIVLSIQLYFWLHLSEYRMRKFPMPDIAWIGSYTSFVPQCVFFITTICTPVGVLTYILFFQHECPVSSRIFSDILLGATALLACLCWNESIKGGREFYAPS